MKSVFIASVVLSTLFLICFFTYLFLPNGKGKFIFRDAIVLVISFLLVISLFLNFFTNQVDSFYFEVSPNRKRCLVDQVSLDPNSRNDDSSCGCCPKGTTGGYPSRHYDHIDPIDEQQEGGGGGGGEEYDHREEEWIRQDNWTSDPYLVGSLPPTTYVPSNI